MNEWEGQGIWWVIDYSYIVSRMYHSFSRSPKDQEYEQNCLDPVKPTIDGTVGLLMWGLDQSPEMTFIALDSGNSWRRSIYPEYKAFRERPPEYHACYAGCLEDIKLNFLDVTQTVAADGFEADDVIASVAKMAVDSGKKCIITTGDKDTKQCLRRGSVMMHHPIRDAMGLSDWGYFNADMAEASWGGLKVEQFVDYQILLGDDCDNIPGCKGIGEKKAVSLLKKYGSIAKMKEVVDEIPGADGKNLKAFFLDQEPIVRQLVTLRDDVDFQNVFL